MYFLIGSGKPQTTKNDSGNFLSDGNNLDLDKLSKSVAVAETSGCKDGTAIKRKNCHGIMTWKTGKRQPAYFASYEESHAAFKKIWSKSYKVYPTKELAIKYSGSDKSCTWLSTVDIVYKGATNWKCDKKGNFVN